MVLSRGRFRFGLLNGLVLLLGLGSSCATTGFHQGLDDSVQWQTEGWQVVVPAPGRAQTDLGGASSGPGWKIVSQSERSIVWTYQDSAIFWTLDAVAILTVVPSSESPDEAITVVLGGPGRELVALEPESGASGRRRAAVVFEERWGETFGGPVSTLGEVAVHSLAPAPYQAVIYAAGVHDELPVGDDRTALYDGEAMQQIRDRLDRMQEGIRVEQR